MSYIVLGQANSGSRVVECIEGASNASAEGGIPLPLTVRFVSPQRWDESAYLFDDICQEQMHVFAARRWPAMQIDCLHFYGGSELLAGCLVMKRHVPLGLGGVAVCKWGPMVRFAGRDDAGQIHDAALGQLAKIYADEQGLMLSVLARPRPAKTNSAFEQLGARGFEPGSGLQFPARYFVNVAMDDAAMRASLDQKWRSHLTRSERNNLTFEHCDMDKMSAFYPLYEAMAARKRFPDYSAYQTLEHMMENIHPSARPALFLVRHEQEAVAGGLVFAAGDTAVYLYGATGDKALPLRAGYFLQWNILRWLARQDRIKWYDLGGTDGFAGLHQFKKGLVGKTGVISPVPVPMSHARAFLPRVTGRTLFWIRDLRAQFLRRITGH